MDGLAQHGFRIMQTSLSDRDGHNELSKVPQQFRCVDGGHGLVSESNRVAREADHK